MSASLNRRRRLIASLVQQPFELVGEPFPFGRQLLAGVGESLSLVSQALTFVGDLVPGVGGLAPTE